MKTTTQLSPVVSPKRKTQPAFKNFSKQRGLFVVTTHRMVKEESPPSPGHSPSEDLYHFERSLTPILLKENEDKPRLFMGSELIAKDKDILLKNGITHVLNCSGTESPCFFPNLFRYKVIAMQDAPHMDYRPSFFVEVVSFIEEAWREGGRVFVHCRKGVSRSATVLIAFLMFKNNWSYEQAAKQVKKCRPTSQPNAGFVFSLMDWEAHLQAHPQSQS